jgi:hypothetical protein
MVSACLINIINDFQCVMQIMTSQYKDRSCLKLSHFYHKIPTTYEDIVVFRCCNGYFYSNTCIKTLLNNNLPFIDY